MDLFSYQKQVKKERQGENEPAVSTDSRLVPLAERMRPKTLDEFYGNDDVIGKGTLLRQAIESDSVFSMILFAPPGCGKTSLCNVITHKTRHHVKKLSAVTSNLKEVKGCFEEAEKNLRLHNRQTILIIDEIHRFNKAQQDALLPHVEKGTVILIGATTENPAFEVNSSLMSRCHLIQLKPLGKADIVKLVTHALDDQERGLGMGSDKIEESALNFIAEMSNGDARQALNLLEAAAGYDKTHITLETCKQALQKTHIRYDKDGDEHYSCASAFIKSLRGSDPDAALYYLARMIQGGEDPKFVARRLVIFASEDIGNADPNALTLAVSCQQAVHFVGLPECQYNLAQTVIYLSLAPKSNTTGSSYFPALKDVENLGNLDIPNYLKNPITQEVLNLDDEGGYNNPHSNRHHVSPQPYLPKELQKKTYFRPGENGFEATLKKRYEQIVKFKKEQK